LDPTSLQGLTLYTACAKGASKAEAAGLQPPKTPQNRNLKNTDFVDIIVSKVLRGLPSSRNQPLKSADD
jgi:hypothetical protein